MIPGFEDQLIGALAGDDRELNGFRHGREERRVEGVAETGLSQLPDQLLVAERSQVRAPR